MKRSRQLFLAISVLAAAAQADVVLHAHRLLDVRTGNVSDAYIVVHGDRIASIGSSAPAGAQVIDLGNATVLPGFIDCHVHLESDWNDFSASGSLRRSAPQKTLLGLQNAQIYLHRGFTTVRDAGTDDLAFGTIALRDAFASGMFDGPRVFVAGIPIGITGGHADLNPLAPDVTLPPMPNVADTPDEARKAVHYNIKYGADWIKVMASGGVLDPFSDYTVQELSDDTLRAIVETAHLAKRRVMAHAEGIPGIKAAVRAGVDSIEHGTMLDEEAAAMMEQRGTWLVPTLETFQRGVEIGLTSGQEPVMLEKGKAILKYQQPAFERAIAHHLHIAFGLDDEPKYTTREFQALVKGGLTPLQALQTATVNAAQLLSVDAGSIEAGKFADIIAIDGDPLQNIGNVERVVFVMKGGKVIVSPAVAK
ncbi:MAG TPA: amidohydrolase family protein [Thermoanaerobaculia bacterium]|nr:amidohydrolase family protein [Thermoanaerobaculia bacterium]